MFGFALRATLARRARAGLTTLAVLISVALISGTLVFTDTIDSAFRQVFAGAASGASVVVSSRQNITSQHSAPASIPDSLLKRIRRLPGVAAAQGQVSDLATIVGNSGGPVGSGGLPALAISYAPPPFTGVKIIAGHPPHGPNEVAIDAATADRAGYRIGDFVPIVADQPVRSFQITGLATLGGGARGGETFAAFDLATAQALYGKTGHVDTLLVAARAGVPPARLAAEIQPLLGSELIARTTQGNVDAEVRQVSDRLRVQTGGLLAFAVLAVLVGALLIFNTLSITVTQRSEELAVLRALGATRGQVMRTVLFETTLIGLAGSLVGLAIGPAAAIGIRALFNLAGLDLPSGGVVLTVRTILIAVGSGLVATIVAGVVPALRATRTSPLEAMRATTAPPAQRRGGSLVLALVALALAGGGLTVIFTSSGVLSDRLRASAIGGALLVVALLLAGPLFVPVLTRVLGRPLLRRRGIVGQLAREHSAEHPVRTAMSASSLMIGLALALFVTVYANGLRASTRNAIRQSFIGDLAIQNEDGSSPIPAASVRAAAELPGVLAVSSLKSADATLGSAGSVTAEAVDPTTIGQVYRFDWISGSAATVQNLGLDDALIERDTARAAHLAVGDQATLTTATGLKTVVTIQGIYRDRGLLRGITLPVAGFDRIFHQPRLQSVFIRLTPGSSRGAALATLAQSLTPFPGVVARPQGALAAALTKRVRSVIVLVYALLALSVLMSLVGIGGTLNLQVFERTRELGMLRAIGLTPTQARSLLRSESAIAATIGTLLGLLLGLVLAWTVTHGLADEGVTFSIPWLQAGLLVVAGFLSAILAAFPPARRASRVDVLAAIAHQ